LIAGGSVNAPPSLSGNIVSQRDFFGFGEAFPGGAWAMSEAGSVPKTSAQASKKSCV